MNAEKFSIPLEDQPLDCHFHPSNPTFAAGIITGHLQCFSYAAEAPSLQISIKAHSDSCRTVQYSPDGGLLLTGSPDKSILAVDTATGKPTARRKGAHPAAINRLLFVSDTAVVSGDDNGGIKLWDMREKDSCASFNGHTDYIADFAVHEAEACVCAVSGDGTLSVNDLRTNKMRARSEDDADDELVSIGIVKNGKKVICGSQSGVLQVFSWGAWNGCSDRFPGHPSSVDAMVAFDADTVISGCNDGLIRILAIQPHKMLGVVGEHDEYPVERLALSADKRLLASASHDNTVKLWDMACLTEAEISDSDAEAPLEETADKADTITGSSKLQVDKQSKGPLGKRRKKQQKVSGKTRSVQQGTFFEGLL